MRGDDVAESHAADRIGREPRVHADLHGHTVQIERAVEWTVRADHEGGRPSASSRDGDVIAVGNVKRSAARFRGQRAADVVPVEAEVARRQAGARAMIDEAFGRTAA